MPPKKSSKKGTGKKGKAAQLTKAGTHLGIGRVGRKIRQRIFSGARLSPLAKVYLTGVLNQIAYQLLAHIKSTKKPGTQTASRDIYQAIYDDDELRPVFLATSKFPTAAARPSNAISLVEVLNQYDVQPNVKANTKSGKAFLAEYANVKQAALSEGVKYKKSALPGLLAELKKSGVKKASEKAKVKKASKKPATKKGSKKASKKPATKKGSKKASSKKASKKPASKKGSKKASKKTSSKSKKASSKKASSKKAKKPTQKKKPTKKKNRASAKGKKPTKKKNGASAKGKKVGKSKKSSARKTRSGAKY